MTAGRSGMGRNRIVRGVLLLLFLSGCSTAQPGSVVMKISDSVAHIELSPSAVRAGDRVALIESHCPGRKMPSRRRKPSSDKCRKFSRGIGTVTQILNERYAVAEFPNGPDYDEGDAVELFQGQPPTR